jgi:hypothetical protein
MKQTLLSGVVVGLLLLPTISNASCHQECIPAGPWESACPICNYDTRTPPDCVNHISEHSGCDYSDTPTCPTQRNPIFLSDPPDWTYSNEVPDCSDTTTGC